MLAEADRALGISVTSGRVRAEGDLDFRGTLGVDREGLFVPMFLTGVTLQAVATSAKRCCGGCGYRAASWSRSRAASERRRTAVS